MNDHVVDFSSQQLLDLDAGAARAPLPARALSDDVCRWLKLPDRAVDDYNMAPRLPTVPSNKAKVGRFSLLSDMLHAPQRKTIADQQNKIYPMQW